MDCYIVCNMFPPLVSETVRAPGMRAHQLAEQALLQFNRVRYVMLKSRYDMLTKSHLVCYGVRSHRDFIIVHDSLLQHFLKHLEPSVFVFTQLEMGNFFRHALNRHFVIYDMLASKLLELRCSGSNAKQLAIFEDRANFFANHAHRILINSEKLRQLDAELLDPQEHKIVNNPFCPVRLPVKSHSSRGSILFFSSFQKWTNNSRFLKAMADFLADRPDLPVIFVSPRKSHEDPESIAVSRFQQMPNVRQISSLSYPAFLSLYSNCSAVMDWSTMNEERLISTSTRLIQAVGCGAAVFGNANTGLDNYWGGYPGETSEAEPDVEKLGGFIERALNGEYETDLARAAKWNNSVLTDSSVFGGIQ